MSSDNETSLEFERKGATVQVVGVVGDDPVARRLIDLGFRPGTEVQVERVAPFGDPVQYRLHGYRLALRKCEARRVLVKPLPMPVTQFAVAATPREFLVEGRDAAVLK